MQNLTHATRKLTDSTLGRVAAAALMSAGAAAALSGSIMLGKSLSPLGKRSGRAAGASNRRTIFSVTLSPESLLASRASCDDWR
jgi:hypothetical protein